VLLTLGVKGCKFGEVLTDLMDIQVIVLAKDAEAEEKNYFHTGLTNKKKTNSAIVFLTLCLGILAPLEAKAFPFERTPDGFLQYLNSVKWDDSYLRNFYNPRKCGRYYWEDSYFCRVDYDETTSLGRRTCINGVYYYHKEIDRVNSSDDDKSRECSEWEKVELGNDWEKDVVEIPTPAEPKSQSKEIAQATGNAKIPLDAGGLLVLAGVVIGFGINSLIGRKKG